MLDLRDALADVCTVAVTPMTAAGALDHASAERLAVHIATSGVGTVTVGGSVGEFMALSRTERRELVEIFVAAAPPEIPMVAAVAGDFESAGQAAADAAATGAKAIMVHQPANPFASPEGWVAYHQHVAANTELPLVLYLRDATIEARHLLTLTRSCPTVIAVKYAVPDPIRLAGLTAALGDRLTWLCGTAELWAPFAWVAGAQGFTSGLANVDACLPRRLLDELRTGRPTERTWRTIAPFEQLRANRGGAANVAVVKAALVQRGVIATDTVRPPVSGLTDDESLALSEIMAALAAYVEQSR
jgi:4-hydroxy-tetrahydrodipicolinate synthase